MKLLQKMFMIVMIVLVACNVNATLNFDNIAAVHVTSQFQPEWYNAGVINTNAPSNGQPYIYFTVIPVGGIVAIGAPVALAPLNRRNPHPRAHRIPQNGETNIYFPENGHQPTTEEAIKYSCANIDNTQISEITNWYMKMFGVIPHNGAGATIQAGWNNPAVGAPAANRIIRFDFGEYVQNLANKFPQIIPHAPAPLQLNAVNLAAPNIANQLNAATAPQLTQLRQDIEAARAHIANLLAAPHLMTLQEANHLISDIVDSLSFLEWQLGTVAPGTVQQFTAGLEPIFRNNFRMLASTSVGRVLLYRLLIEINRRLNAGVTTGCCENNIAVPLPHVPNPFTVRDSNRMIKIGLGNFSFSRGGQIFGLPMTEGNIFINNGLSLIDVIGGNLGINDVIRQHESNFDTGLFHEMIHWYQCLRNPMRVEKELLGDNQNYEQNFLWLHYWGTLQGSSKLLAKYKWTSSIARGLDLAEARVILGAPRLVNSYYVTDEKAYFEGNDLSDNLYRACNGILPLRYGYNQPTSYEDSKIIDKVISASSHNIIPYRRKLGAYRKVD